MDLWWIELGLPGMDGLEVMRRLRESSSAPIIVLSARGYLRVYMAQLRHKLEAEPSRPCLLLTEPGVGCRLSDEGGA